MGFFDKKKSISREEFRKSLRKAPSGIPGSSRKFYRREREGLEKDLFGKKYGSHISRGELKDRVQELRKEKYRAKTQAGRDEIDRKVRYFEKHGGIKK